MPRRRPAQIRPLPVVQRHGRPIPQVSGVSAATLRAIAELERDRLMPGDIAQALERWSRFVHGPVRAIHGYEPEACPCCELSDPVARRTELRMALHVLPAKAARELRAIVRPLDEHYLSRTTLDPDHAHIRDLLT